MRIFIPEGFIYFYVYGGGEYLLESIYGSTYLTFLPSYFYGANVYDVIGFNDNKIHWGRVWKAIYFRQEAPFWLNLTINDRFNWAYPHSLKKLLLDRHESIYISKYCLIKGFYSSPHNVPFYRITVDEGPMLEVEYEIWIKFVINKLNRNLCPIVDSMFMREGLANRHHWNYKYQLIFLVTGTINFIIFNVFFLGFKSMMFICYMKLFNAFFFSFILFFLIFIIIVIFLKYLNDVDYAFKKNTEEVKYYINDIFDLLNRFLINAYINDNSFLFRFLGSFTNNFKSFKTLLGHNKSMIWVLKFKRYIFNFNLNFILFVIVCYFKYIINFFIFFLDIPFYIFEKFSVNIKRLYFPFRFFISKYPDNYLLLTVRHLHFWLFTLLAFIFNGIRNSSVKSGFLGWIKWMQIYTSWDDFVDKEWEKIVKYQSEQWRKTEAKLKSKKKKEVQSEEDERQRILLRKRGIDDDQVERIIKYQNEVRKNKPKMINVTQESKMTYSEYVKKYGLEDLGRNKYKLSDKKGYSAYWKKIYNIFLLNFYEKVLQKYKDKLNIDFELEEEINPEFIKEMSYFNWLMERKYLLLKADYGYWDYMDWMTIQKDQLQYYAETGRLVRLFNVIFNIFNYFYYTDNRYAKLFSILDRKYAINLFVRVYISTYRFFLKNLTTESFFIKYSLLFVSNIFTLTNLFSLLFYYAVCYVWFLLYAFSLFFKLFFSNDRIIIKYYYSVFFAKLVSIFKVEHKYVYFFLSNFVFLVKLIITISIKIILLPFKIIIFILKSIVKMYNYLFFKFSNIIYWFKRRIFDFWYYCYLNLGFIMKKLRHIFIIFLLLYFLLGVTPLEFIHSLTALFLNFLHEIMCFFSFESNIFFSLKEWFIFLYDLDFDIKKRLIFYPFYKFYKFYLYHIYHIYIYHYFTPIATYTGYFLTLPLYVFLNYSNYTSFITSWHFYTVPQLELLDYLIKQEFDRELTWQAINHYKTIFGGFLWHPVYRFIKNDYNERSVLFKFFWYIIFTRLYKLKVSLFFYILPSYIFIFPYWVLRYGAYYVVWKYLDYGSNSSFLNLATSYVCFWYYLRWHLLAWFVTVISIFTIYPFAWFQLLLNLTYANFVLNSNIIASLYTYIYIFFDFIGACLSNLYVLYLYYKLIYFYSYDFFIYKYIFYIYLCLEILFKFIIYFYLSTISMFKFLGHMFQCIIPFLRYVIKYECFIFLISLDLIRSIINLLLIPIYVSCIFFNAIWSVLITFFNLFNHSVIGLFIGYFTEFFYKIILYPYYVVHLKGFFDYLGRHGLFYGSGSIAFFTIFEFVDVMEIVHTKRSYFSVNRRWSLGYIDGYNGLDTAFAFRSINYREIGSGSAFFHLYVWTCYIIFLLTLSLFFNFINRYLRHKDNIMPDSMYLWYNLTSGNKINRFSNSELMWLTQNKWLFSFYSIENLFEGDSLKQFKNKPQDFSKIMLNNIKSSVSNGYKTDFNSDDYNKFINYLLVYGTYKYHRKLKKKDKYAGYIRYLQIFKKVESLFKAKVYSKNFAKQLLGSIDFKLSKKVNVHDFENVSKYNKFWHYWLYFVVPLTLYSKYSYGTFNYFKNRIYLQDYFKSLKLLIMNKSNEFKDLHDFYFLEHDFYDDFYEHWMWAKRKGTVLRSLISSRYVNRMVYSSRNWPNKNLYNKVYVKYLYEYIGKIINLSTFDSKFFNFVNFRMHNILNTDRIVQTQLSGEQIEQLVLEDYTHFMEAGWEQDRMDDGAFGIYKYLSDRMFDSFLSNDYTTAEGIWMSRYGDLSNKLSLRNYYGPLPDPWLALTVILPFMVAFYFYGLFVTYSSAVTNCLPLYTYELSYFFIFFIYHIQPHFFFATIMSSFFFYPKLLNRKRKFKTFAASRIISVVEKFFPHDELLRLLINFSAFAPVFFFLIPGYDFFVFYILFFFVTIIFYKIIVDMDI